MILDKDQVSGLRLETTYQNLIEFGQHTDLFNLQTNYGWDNFWYIDWVKSGGHPADLLTNQTVKDQSHTVTPQGLSQHWQAFNPLYNVLQVDPLPTWALIPDGV